MRIISQNVTNYGISVPEDTIFRINLAWCDSINSLETVLKRHENDEIFLDLPARRIKPPNNKYRIEDLVPVIESYKQIKYFAISNIESASDLENYLSILPDRLIFVPKIESPKAIDNISEIISAIPSDEKIIMLDHDDLFTKLIKNNETSDSFQKYIRRLVEYANDNDITLLRTIGVIFSDDEKRISDYVR